MLTRSRIDSNNQDNDHKMQDVITIGRLTLQAWTSNLYVDAAEDHQANMSLHSVLSSRITAKNISEFATPTFDSQEKWAYFNQGDRQVPNLEGHKWWNQYPPQYLP